MIPSSLELEPVLDIEGRMARLEQLFAALQKMLCIQVPHESSEMISSIQCLCARHYGLSPEQLLSRCRRTEFTWPRFIAMYLCRKHTAASLMTLGARFNRDHGTIMNGLSRMEARMQTEPKFAAKVALIESQLPRREAINPSDPTEKSDTPL